MDNLSDGWRPATSVDSSLRRAAMLNRARIFFAKRNVLEVDTPILSRFAVSDPHIESIEVSMAADVSESWYLQTSPEFFMKRLLSAGYPDIYEICKVFRDTENGRHHHPEFTLVEWYRLGFGLNEIMHETVEFIESLSDTTRFARPASFKSYRRAFAEFGGIELESADIGTLARQVAADSQLQASLADSRDDWLDLVLVERICPQFPPDQLTVLYHYPASQAALARICPGDDSVADRFEVFAGTLELANGYVELLDARAHIDRFEEDQAQRGRAGRPQRPIDIEFIAAVESGMPACAGVAVGFDRVHLLNEGADDIRRALCFPMQRLSLHG